MKIKLLLFAFLVASAGFSVYLALDTWPKVYVTGADAAFGWVMSAAGWLCAIELFAEKYFEE